MTSPLKWAMYIDGYNFYYAIKNGLGPQQLYLGWCHFGKLAKEIIGNRGDLVRINYFTSEVEDLGAPGEQERQAVWLRALDTIPKLEIIKGFHSDDPYADPLERQQTRSEKETDVNIAISIISDAPQQLYDRVILLSGDYDQRPTVRTVSDAWKKRVEVWLPPGQQKNKWAEVEKSPLVSIHSLSTDMLKRNRLNDTLRDHKGVFTVPKIWAKPS